MLTTRLRLDTHKKHEDYKQGKKPLFISVSHQFEGKDDNMKTVEEIIEYLENEKTYCLDMHKNYRESDPALSFQYLVSAVTITGLLAEIKE